MKTLAALLILTAALTAKAQTAYSVDNTACSGTPAVCTVAIRTNLVREVAQLALKFNAGQSPSNQNKNPFGVILTYGPEEGSNLAWTANQVPVIWGFQPGGFYVAEFVLQLGPSNATKLAVLIRFKRISDPVLGTLWVVDAKQDGIVGTDLTQAY